MEEVESPKHLVVLGALGLQDPPLGQEIQMAQDLQPVLVLPLILGNLEIRRNQDPPKALEIQECLFLLLPQYQILPCVLVVLAVQSFQEFLLYPFLLYRDKSQVALPTGWVQENLADQPHPGLPFAPLLPHRDFPSNLDALVGPEVPLTLALQDTLWGPPVLLHPKILVSRAVLGHLCLPEYL